MRHYLDHAASSPLRPAAAEAWAEAAALTGNPSSTHAAGRQARARLEDAREQLADAVVAHPSEVVFTSGGTEADNLAVLGVAASARADGPARLATSTVEHPAVHDAVASLGERALWLGVDADGVVTADALAGLSPGVALVSVMAVNNETGTVQPLDAVVDAVRRVGAVAHSDGVQALGHVPLDFAASGLDLLSLSAHKLGGPVGVGALIVRRGVRLAPTGFGGGQEARLRSGTVPVALAAGFAAAAAQAVAERSSEAARLGALRAELAAAVRALPDTTVNGGVHVSPAICHVTFRGCRADDLLLLLDAAGIDCSTGSACTAGVHQPSRVLLAMGRPEADATASLRFSFGPTTTAADIRALTQALPGVVATARAATGSGGT
ncbi:cysteine desulfurase family protein [Propioniciclava sp.]|uniref:cysteine desulfurase family protein n=1 Tax=Propioniciclava sp. TaxID=2038686 RepID=UPI00262F0211|nr:cysteine desulfurase family protein [Propioniciclava sp.]